VKCPNADTEPCAFPACGCHQQRKQAMTDTKASPVLSDEEIDALQDEYDCYGGCDAPRIHDFARAVIAAYEAKLRQQEPAPAGQEAQPVAEVTPGQLYEAVASEFSEDGIPWARANRDLRQAYRNHAAILNCWLKHAATARAAAPHAVQGEPVATVTKTAAGWVQARVFGVVIGARYGEKNVAEYDAEGIVERINAAAPSTILPQIRDKLNIMLASATTLGDEYVEGYQIKTGALHRIIGLMQTAGYPVTVPLAAPPQAPAAVQVEARAGVDCAHEWKVTSQRLLGMWCKCSKCGATKEETWD
jgi:hypothetical protein